MANNYKVDYDDKRFADVEADKKEALGEVEGVYDGMIDQSQGYYDAQIEATRDWAEEQKKIQTEQSEFAIEQIEQQKEQAGKDYIREQQGAYVDWQKQSNQYGAEAEKMASAGLSNTGYSESSQVAMYNQYQNRVATARDVYARAVLNYDNAIKEARLQNNAALAELAYQAFMQELQLSLEGFQYKNNLIIEKTEKKLAVDEMFYGRMQDVLSQINTENALKEQARQHDAEMGAKAAALAEEQRQFDAQLKEEQRQFNVSLANSGGSSGSGIQARRTADSPGGTYITDNYDGSVIISGNSLRTPYYKGYLNADAKKYGTMSNGYQPKGITGHGKLKDSGEEPCTLESEVVYGPDKGKEVTLTQTVWEAEDGTLWYWEGRKNKYIQISETGGGGRSF